jgi:uncharacterized protein YjbI with pentapeptide repeats
LTERRLWFVRRKETVKGPFLPAQITRNILLGRIRPDDELSCDEINWQEVSLHRELYPEVMKDAKADKEQIETAKMQVDERILDQRRQKQEMKQERRRTRERRGNESESMLLHRQHRKELNDTYKTSLKRPQFPMLSILLVIIAIFGFGYILKNDNNDILADCSLPPSPGVNWSNCSFIELNAENQELKSSILTDATINKSNFLGANLSGSDMAYAEMSESDFSYANLERVRLIGANLKHSDFRYANLEGADLSFADLSNALLAGANISNTRFDNTIWTDGQICKKGSIGSCN